MNGEQANFTECPGCQTKLRVPSGDSPFIRCGVCSVLFRIESNEVSQPLPVREAAFENDSKTQVAAGSLSESETIYIGTAQSTGNDHRRLNRFAMRTTYIVLIVVLLIALGGAAASYWFDSTIRDLYDDVQSFEDIKADFGDSRAADDYEVNEQEMQRWISGDGFPAHELDISHSPIPRIPPTVDSLIIDGRILTSYEWSQISRLENLKKIQLSNTQITERAWLAIRSKPLYELDLHGSNWSEQDTNKFSDLLPLSELNQKSLMVLNLADTNLTLKGMGRLDKIPHLQKLNLKGADLEQMKEYEKSRLESYPLEKLEELDLREVKIDSMEKIFSILKSIKKLKISGDSHSDQVQELAERDFPNMELIVVESPPESDSK